MPTRTALPVTRETIRTVLSKWMAGDRLTAAENALVLRLRAVNMAQQLARVFP